MLAKRKWAVVLANTFICGSLEWSYFLVSKKEGNASNEKVQLHKYERRVSEDVLLLFILKVQVCYRTKVKATLSLWGFEEQHSGFCNSSQVGGRSCEGKGRGGVGGIFLRNFMLAFCELFYYRAVKKTK